MRTTTVAKYAMRINIGQVSDASSRTLDRTLSASAAVMAVFGIALSSFSCKQMLNNSNRLKRD